jgi:hypothetical protein
VKHICNNIYIPNINRSAKKISGTPKQKGFYMGANNQSQLYATLTSNTQKLLQNRSYVVYSESSWTELVER